ncbi:hypothetical protein ACJX0J_009974, partial [Zea mays]
SWFCCLYLYFIQWRPVYCTIEVRDPLPLTIHHMPIAVTFAYFGEGNIVEEALTQMGMFAADITSKIKKAQIHILVLIWDVEAQPNRHANIWSGTLVTATPSQPISTRRTVHFQNLLIIVLLINNNLCFKSPYEFLDIMLNIWTGKEMAVGNLDF